MIITPSMAGKILNRDKYKMKDAKNIALISAETLKLSHPLFNPSLAPKVLATKRYLAL